MAYELNHDLNVTQMTKHVNNLDSVDSPSRQISVPNTENRSAILVLGMHRSGTSAVTRVINLLGATLPKHLMPAATQNNPTGFWESANLQRFHDDLLASAGSAWDDWRPFNEQWYSSGVADQFSSDAHALLKSEFGRAPLLVLKDPRVCRFAPFWFRLLTAQRIRTCCVLPIRNPLEVAESLSRRDGLDPSISHLIWLRHVLDAELASREKPRAIVSYEHFLDDWREIMRRAGCELGVAWPKSWASAECDIDRFLERSLRHHRRSVDQVLASSAVCDWVKTAYVEVLRLETDKDCAAALHRLDVVRADFDRASAAIGSAAWHARSVVDLESELTARLAEIHQLQHRVAESDAQFLQEREQIVRLQNELGDQTKHIAALEYEVRDRDRRLSDHTRDIFDQRARAEALQQDLVQQLTAERGICSMLSRALNQTRRDYESLALYLNDIHSSSSWQFARPLRTLEAAAPATMRWLNSLSKAGFAALTFRLGRRLRLHRTARLIERSGLFDPCWYTTAYPSVAKSAVRPIEHWLLCGQHSGYNPHPVFDIEFYRSTAPSDVSDGRIGDPITDYLSRGGDLDVSPHPLFNTRWYLGQLPNGGEGLALTPLEHYLQLGWRHGLDPHPAFSTNWYLSTYPDVSEANVNPLLHFLTSGWREQREPSSSFSLNWYLAEYPDIANGEINPFVHYLTYGASEGRRPSPAAKAGDPLRGQSETRSSAKSSLTRDPKQGLEEQIEPSLTPISSPATHQEPRADHSSVSLARGYVERAHLVKVYDSFLSSARRDPDGDRYVEDDDRDYDSAHSLVKVIAFYLPQFHPIPENDAWWGKGFTEWTNVSKAVPQFVGHEQPKLPGELGFYDLRLPEVQRRQATLARRYGIHGFCYHYYWFNGRRLLERPLDQVLADPSIDFPFCICWANENWTRRWDGLDQEVLLGQSHTPESDHAFIADVIPVFRDPRYITVHGRPILIVYRVGLMPDPEGTARRWREHCSAEGIADPYLVAAQTFGTSDPTPFGFDAAVEFPPHNLAAHEITSDVDLLNGDYNGHVYSYRSLVENFSTSNAVDYIRYRCVIPAWDNEARKPGSGNCYAGATPRLYGDWLNTVCEEAVARPEPDERLVFVNAWNEWAEGAYLEPDRRYGYAYLRTTRSTLERLAQTPAGASAGGIEWLGGPPQNQRSDVAVVVHVYYTDVWVKIAATLARILPNGFDLFVTVSSDSTADLIRSTVPANVKQITIGRVANRGRDMAPFIGCLRVLDALDYLTICKIHTKSASTRADGSVWAADMFTKLVGSAEAVDAIVRAFRADSRLSLLMPTGHALPVEHYWGDRASAARNQYHVRDCAQAVGLPVRYTGYHFPAGSMYWFRPNALASIARLPINSDSFPEEAGQTDGTLAHAMERLVGLAASTDGWHAAVTGDVVDGEMPTEWLSQGIYPFACATSDGVPIEGEIHGIM